MAGVVGHGRKPGPLFANSTNTSGVHGPGYGHNDPHSSQRLANPSLPVCVPQVYVYALLMQRVCV